MLGFLEIVVAQFQIGYDRVRVGVVIFSNYGEVEFGLNRFYDKRHLMDAIQGITYVGGTTNTADGLQQMRERVFNPSSGDRPDVPNVAIVVMDGAANERVRDTVPEAFNARSRGIHIIAAGITHKADVQDLHNIASSQYDVIQIRNFNRLYDMGLDRMVQGACYYGIYPPELVLTTTTPNPTPPPRPPQSTRKYNLHVYTHKP